MEVNSKSESEESAHFQAVVDAGTAAITSVLSSGKTTRLWTVLALERDLAGASKEAFEEYFVVLQFASLA